MIKEGTDLQVVATEKYSNNKTRSRKDGNIVNFGQSR